MEKGKTFDNLFLQLCSMREATIALRNSAQCYEATWMGGEFGGEWLHVYAWLGPFAVRLKLTVLFVNWLYPNTKEKVYINKI